MKNLFLLLTFLLISLVGYSQNPIQSEFFVHLNVGQSNLSFDGFNNNRPPLSNTTTFDNYRLLDINIRGGYNIFFKPQSSYRLGLQLGAGFGSTIPTERFYIMPYNTNFIGIFTIPSKVPQSIEVSVGAGWSAHLLYNSLTHAGVKFLFDLRYRYRRFNIGLHANYTYAFTQYTDPLNSYLLGVGIGYQFLTNQTATKSIQK